MNSYKFDQTEGASFGLDDFNATLNKVATIPHSETVMGAWQQTEVAIKSYHVVNRNWDDWWNSLTDLQKQKLVEEQEAMEKQRENEQR